MHHFIITLKIRNSHVLSFPSDNIHARFFLCTSLLLRKTVDFESYISEACERYRFRRRTLRDDLNADGGVVIEVFARC